MRFSGLILLLVIAAGGVGQGRETNFHARLLAGVNTARPGVQQVTDPMLVDTNNTGNKVQGCRLRLDSVAAGGPISGIQFGMSMDEIVRHWGKPPQAWWNYQGGPRFDYEGVILYFVSNRLSGICINSPALRTVHFEPKVAPQSTLAQWQATLKAWTLSRARNAVQLLQATNQVLLTLSFRHGEKAPLFQLRLEQWADPRAPLKPGLNRLGAYYQPPRDKSEAVILAKLGALDQGWSWWLQKHKHPTPANVVPMDRSGRSYWMVFFEYLRPVPDSGIIALVDRNTGEVEMIPE